MSGRCQNRICLVTRLCYSIVFFVQLCLPFSIVRPLKQYVLNCYRYSDHRWKTFLGSWELWPMGIFRNTHFALQRSTNSQSNHFGLQEICNERCGTVEIWIAVSSHSSHRWKGWISSEKRKMRDSDRFVGWSSKELRWSWLPKIEHLVDPKADKHLKMLELPIPSQDYRSLCRVHAKIVWQVNKAAIKNILLFVCMVKRIVCLRKKSSTLIQFLPTIHFWEVERSNKMSDQDNNHPGKIFSDDNNRDRFVVLLGRTCSGPQIVFLSQLFVHYIPLP